MGSRSAWGYAMGTILKRILPALVVLGAAAAVAVLVHWVVTSQQPPARPAVEVPPVDVTVQVVRALPAVPDTMTLFAVVEPNRVVRVCAEVAGRIEKVNYEEGAECGPRAPKAGEPPPLAELNADLLRAELKSAQAMAELAEAAYQRIKKYREKGGGTPQDLDKARAEKSARTAALELTQARLDRTRIYAPVSGVFDKLLAEEGEYVGPGDPVARIVDMATVKVAAQVPERDIPFFKVGDRAEVFADIEGATKKLHGPITYIGQLADDKTRATRIEITLDNRRRALRSGAIVRARLTRRVLRNVIMIPLAAVIPLEDAKAVYVVEDGAAVRREVTIDTRFIRTAAQLERGRDETEESSEQVIQVTRGLKPGDLLIVAGHRFVTTGQAVNVIGAPNDESPSGPGPAETSEGDSRK